VIVATSKGQRRIHSIPMLIAEELEVRLRRFVSNTLPPNDKLFGNPLSPGCRRR